MSDQPQGSRTAPFYDIPSRNIVSVEHPAIIKNVDKAIDTLHGNQGISKILNPPKADTPAYLSLRPEDAMSRPVQSTSSPSNNILLKVTVPKRTGRKRKRGSNEPFTGVPVATLSPQLQPRRSAMDLLRSLSDNVGKYQAEPVGMVNRTHVFRGMPDFVFSTTASSFTNRFRDQILSYDLEQMKKWDLDMSKGTAQNADIIPPPSFSTGDIPFNYAYRQNQAVRQAVDSSGNVTTVNTQKTNKVLTHLVSYDIPEVPQKPQDDCPPLATQDKVLQETVAIVEELFNKRPAWTRRGLRNHLKTIEQRYALRYAIPYVGYIMRSGPWRDAIIKFGHDPRTSPDYRLYQTVMFRILPREAEVARDGYAGRRHAVPRLNEPFMETLTSDSHIFTGELPLLRDGRMWMFCDITDPLVSSIVFPSEESQPPNFIRETCDIVSDGWFANATLAKMKLVMRHKILGLLEDRIVGDHEFARILSFPDHATPETVNTLFTLDSNIVTGKELAMATELRSTIKGTLAWREMTNQGQHQDESRGRGRKVQWQDAEGEESEGEEAAIEQEEFMEAHVDEAIEAAVAFATGQADDQDSDEGNEIEESKPKRKSRSRQT
ncbi:RNA polymerase III transcription factor IIIC subunit-domain-containing protein [Aspergillus avenaceus]|uniref:RNA polymerase III transcription factor IIIC subunit-domain-containing protein n=1 Tax=Aspergillus avenaceus TaxID=36643 RepID=A0A5N6U6J0_ASPAV|nr:RNA polymerase III transcription factor IIIC subunit-domain-containing protein [Aspergillus avenaceus]